MIISGRGDVKHTKGLSEAGLCKLRKLIGTVQAVLEARRNKDQDAYSVALEKVPGEYKQSYHDLARMLVQTMIMLMDMRRGREGLAALLKGQWTLREEQGLKFYVKVTFYFS